MEFNLNAVSFIKEKNAVPLDTERTYDVVIIGGGPAGLTAAVYCMRKGVDTAIIVRHVGGQVAETSAVENYMGYRYINGVELVDKFREQVQQFSIGYVEGVGVASVEDGAVKTVLLDDGRAVRGRALVLASGKSWRKLGVPGEQRLTGRGVAYCTICDAPLFAGKTVVVVGGGNSGVEAAIDLAAIAKEVIVVQNLDRLTADRVLTDRLAGFGNVRLVYKSRVREIAGENAVTSVVLDDDTGASTEIAADGIFIEIGLEPNSGFARGIVDMNENGEIIVDCACRTSRAGIFAAGDVTTVPYKQIIIAGGEGAKAALSACDYLKKNE
ncbi:MAG TPA: FAD-dependent oxidoreductase [Spirochaetota bacterium]|jgi:alkyl hydroperoxide reductase subunit F|nr:FAD-dependent oxidoreductase [Spirochaetota bacterium]HPV40356.1 FAD-dependent oxidoreductase [Spirochaetota bacterium]